MDLRFKLKQIHIFLLYKKYSFYFLYLKYSTLQLTYEKYITTHITAWLRQKAATRVVTFHIQAPVTPFQRHKEKKTFWFFLLVSIPPLAFNFP
jgi:hypothetical protein